MNLVATPTGIGRLDNDSVGVAVLDLPHASIEDLLAEPQWRRRIAAAKVTHRASTTTLASPLRPRSFWLVGSNYPGRSGEAPERPSYYLRSPSSLSGPGDRVMLPTGSEVQPDAELAVVIGSTAHRIPESQAWNAIAGITACNDLTARGLLDGGRGVAVAKSSPGFGALGGSLRITTEPVEAEVQLEVDGELRQRATTTEMLFNIAELVSRLSHLTVLVPGDVIATGSPTANAPTRLLPGQTTTVRVSGVHPLITQYIGEETP